MHNHHDDNDHGHDHDPKQMIRDMRKKWLWTNFTVAALGLWLMTSPFTFGYASRAMIWSDVISGAIIVAASLAALWPKCDFFGRWTAGLTGAWLHFAPLFFWAPEPVAYVTDTLVGAIVFTLMILVPMMPGHAHHMVMQKPGPEMPPGWTYNPSTWHQRAPIIICGFAGWFISRYLAAVQLGYIDSAWEPFFGEGTSRVLHSEMSKSWPISDAGLGAVAYTIEALMGFMGMQTRWRTMPWMVTFFGIVVIPLGLVHIALVISQPVVVGYWCTLCLAAAAVMLIMIPLTVDEVVAMLQFMAIAKREKRPLWRTFWAGGTLVGGADDDRTPRYGEPARKMAPAMIWGVSLPWTLVASMAIGIWLMFSPSIFGTSGAASSNDHLAGAIALTIAACATGEVIRPMRILNFPLGLWIAIAPWFLGGAELGSQINDLIAGLAIALLSLPRGRIREHYGSWDRFAYWKIPFHLPPGLGGESWERRRRTSA